MKYLVKLEKNGLIANGVFNQSDESILISVNSEMSLSKTNSLSDTYRSIRDSLIRQKIVDLNASNTKYIFVKEYPFPNPSNAACVITGTQEAWDGFTLIDNGLPLTVMKQLNPNIDWEDNQSRLSKVEFLAILDNDVLITRDRLRALFELMPYQKYGISIRKLGEKYGIPGSFQGDLTALARAINESLNLNYAQTHSESKMYTLVCKGYGIRTKNGETLYNWALQNPLFEALKEKFNDDFQRDFLKQFTDQTTLDKKEIINKKKVIHPKNLILYGPPGTGKTYKTFDYAVALIENIGFEDLPKIYPSRKDLVNKYKEYKESKNILFTTFHQSYGYEEFIEGLKPKESNGMLMFELKEGVFKKIVNEAFIRPTEQFVLIIDEINRGNISRIFGELISLIEEDKRKDQPNELSAFLPLSSKDFSVPNNLFVLGTMNTSDKSISLVDTALRRRFEFVEMTPNPNLVQDSFVREVMIKLNQAIEKENPAYKDLLIGHSYFINEDQLSIVSILNKKIIPLLYEYFFDSSDKVEKVLSDLASLNLKIHKSPNSRITINLS
jgi:5-methylcytosine-specific restriction protein B